MNNSLWSSHAFLLNQNTIIIEICASDLEYIHLNKLNIFIIGNTELFYTLQ